MQIINSIILGIIQGLTEFLPISSSGHLVLYQYFFNNTSMGSDISLEVFLHLGSLFAVIIYFRNDLIDLLCSLFHWKKSLDAGKHYRNRMIIIYLLIATIATGCLYILFGKIIESIFSKPLVVAVFLGVTGLIIFVSDYVKKTEIPMSGMGALRSIVIGIAQGVSMLPGISRSGSTISTSLFLGIKRADAARFSFLLSIPAILAANLSEFKTITELQSYMLLSYIAGALAAFISGFLVISVLIRLIKSAKLKYLAFYCWLISIVSIIIIVT